jgi:hypothetical protein
MEIVGQLALASALSVIHFLYFDVDSDTVSIVVSAASIVAGLLLNLMVLIYSLLSSYIAKSEAQASNVNNPNRTSYNVENFKGVSKETLSNIAFSVLVCILLVISALMVLTTNVWIKSLGHLFLIFFGVMLIVTMMIVLLRFYRLIINDVTMTGAS